MIIGAFAVHAIGAARTRRQAAPVEVIPALPTSALRAPGPRWVRAYAGSLGPGHLGGEPPMKKIYALALVPVAALAIAACGGVKAIGTTGSKRPAVTITDPNGVKCTVKTVLPTGYCPNDNMPAAAKPSPTASAVPDLAVGQTENVEDNNNASDTASVTITSMYNTTQSYGGFESPQNGYFVVANVTASSQFDGFNASESDFYALVNGVRYNEGNGNSIFAVANDDYFDTTLNTGESASGQLYFDLPSIHGTLVYAPNFNSAPIA